MARKVPEFRSGFERTLARSLTKRRVKYEYEHTKYPYEKIIPGGRCVHCGCRRTYVIRQYIPDFFLPRKGIYIEAKGRFRPGDRQKHIQVRKAHPDLDIRFVFMRDNWLTRSRKTRYSEWAENHLFKWAIGEIPDEWI